MVVPVIPKNTVEAVRYKTCFMLFAFGLMAKLANFYLFKGGETMRVKVRSV